jgi:hypothetical protein
VLAGVVADEAIDAARIEDALSKLEPTQRPHAVVRLSDVPLTDGFRPRRAELVRLGASAPRLWPA